MRVCNFDDAKKNRGPFRNRCIQHPDRPRYARGRKKKNHHPRLSTQKKLCCPSFTNATQVHHSCGYPAARNSCRQLQYLVWYCCLRRFTLLLSVPIANTRCCPSPPCFLLSVSLSVVSRLPDSTRVRRVHAALRSHFSQRVEHRCAPLRPCSEGIMQRLL